MAQPGPATLHDSVRFRLHTGPRDATGSRVPYRLALPHRSAPCSSASRTNRRLPDLRVRRIREHDHTGATTSSALFVVCSLLWLFGVHGRPSGSKFDHIRVPRLPIALTPGPFDPAGLGNIHTNVLYVRLSKHECLQ
jgi:hypothetical protein